MSNPPRPPSDARWHLIPSPRSDSEQWLLAVDPVSERIWVHAEPGAEWFSVAGAFWQLATWTLTDDEIEPPEDLNEELAEPLLGRIAHCIVIEEPEYAGSVEYEELFERIPDRFHLFLIDRQEASIRWAAALMSESLSGITDQLITCDDVDRMRAKLAVLDDMTRGWEKAGGRDRLFRSMIEEIDSWRSRLLELMDEHPTMPEEWTVELVERGTPLVARAVIIEDDVEAHPDMQQQICVRLGWLSAMGLEAMLTLALHDERERDLLDLHAMTLQACRDASSDEDVTSATAWIGTGVQCAAQASLAVARWRRGEQTLDEGIDLWAQAVARMLHALVALGGAGLLLDFDGDQSA